MHAVETRIPPQAYFVVSAVFHYLGPAFAVLLFARVDVLGVAWLRIATAALVFAAWRRPWRAFARLDGDGRRVLVAWGLTLAVMNACFYMAIDRLPLATVAAIEFLPVIGLAALGVRSRRNAAALACAVAGVYLVTGVQFAGKPLGVAFAFANAALFAAYIVLAHRTSRLQALTGIDGLAASMLIAAVVITPIGGWAVVPALTDPVALAAGAGVGICSSVVPYVADQLAMRRLARATYALMVSLLPATATVVGIVVLAQLPSLRELSGVALVMAGVAAHESCAKSRAVRGVLIKEWGGPEVLELADELPAPEPGPGQQRVRVTAAGVNFADTHARENVYIAKYELPLVPGTEVAGTLDDGTRVVAMPHHGGYAEYAVADEQSIFPLPDGLGDHEALALLIQGLTAWHLYRTAAQVRPGETVVVHSAAGGTGSLAVQLAKPMGAGRVIASASSEEKRALVAELGADAVIDSAAQDMTQRLLDANGGKPVDVVFDMAGGPVFEQSAEALAPFGRIVVYGIASREQNDLRTGRLMRKSRGVVGFWLMHCLERPETMMREPLSDLFERAARGDLRPQLGKMYALSDVRQAHEDLVGRRTTGKLVLDPSR